MPKARVPSCHCCEKANYMKIVIATARSDVNPSLIVICLTIKLVLYNKLPALAHCSSMICSHTIRLNSVLVITRLRAAARGSLVSWSSSGGR